MTLQNQILTKHESQNSAVYLMDCIEGMKMYPDNHFELAIVDPPYGIGAGKPSDKSGMRKQKNGSKLLVKSVGYTHKDWDVTTPTIEYFKELMRVSKNQIIWGVNYFDFTFKSGRIVWDKLKGDVDQYGCEIAYNSISESRTDIVYYLWSGMMQGRTVSRDVRKSLVQQGNKSLNEQRIHPTQKPVKLYEWLLDNYAKEGDKILDTHLGSQSSRIAAHNRGFDFTGFELDQDYFRDGNKRFEKHISQLRMF